MYLYGGSTPEECWTLVGLGVRMAYDVGAHRRIRSHNGNTAESEEYKRVFWLLLCLDTIMSSLLGRPRAAATNECVLSGYLSRGLTQSFVSLHIEFPVILEGEEPMVAVYVPLLLKMMEIWRRVQDAIVGLRTFFLSF